MARPGAGFHFTGPLPPDPLELRTAILTRKKLRCTMRSNETIGEQLLNVRDAIRIPARGEDHLLTISEVAIELRCSKAHVYNAINGKISGVSPLPAISMGRRKLVRWGSLQQWMRTNERGRIGNDILSASPEVDAVGRARKDFHA